jgi:hypothetical protein
MLRVSRTVVAGGVEALISGVEALISGVWLASDVLNADFRRRS